MALVGESACEWGGIAGFAGSRGEGWLVVLRRGPSPREGEGGCRRKELPPTPPPLPEQALQRKKKHGGKEKQKEEKTGWRAAGPSLATVNSSATLHRLFYPRTFRVQPILLTTRV